MLEELEDSGTTQKEPKCYHPVLSKHCICIVICFFRLVKFRQNKYSRKIIFGQTKLTENNFTSRVWWAWALIEEIAQRAEEMAGEKEIACCVRGYHIYKDIWAAAIREVLVCSTELTKNFRCRIIFA